MNPQSTRSCVPRNIEKEREDLPDEIFLIPESDGEHGDYWSWCDCRAPANDHDPRDAVKYVKNAGENGSYTRGMFELVSKANQAREEMLKLSAMPEVPTAYGDDLNPSERKSENISAKGRGLERIYSAIGRMHVEGKCFK